MITRILRKDWKLLWPAVLGVAGANILLRFVLARIGLFPRFTIGSLVNLLMFFGLIGIILLITLAVQQDAVPGVKQDWLVRPIRRRDLLISKILFVLLAAQGPVFIAEVIQGVANGFPLSASITAPLGRNIWLILMVDLPVLAFATLTSNLMEAVVAGLVLFMLGAGYIGVINMSLVPQPTMDTGEQWITYACMALIAALTAAIVMSLQYRRRRTFAARCAFVSGGIVWLSMLLMPWRPVFALEQRFSAKPGADSTLRLAFARNANRFQLPPGAELQQGVRRDVPVTDVYVPLQIDGLPTDSILISDRAEAAVAAAASRINVTGRELRLPDHASAIAYQRLSIPTAWLVHHEAENARVEIAWSLTLAREQGEHSIAASGGELRSYDLGWCQTSINDADTVVQVHCMNPGKLPDASAFRLENSAAGAANPQHISYAANYSPWLERFGPDSMQRIGANLPFRDPSGLAHYPVDGSQLRSARVLIRSYSAIDHFQRTLDLDGIHLSDWRGSASPVP